ncbi:hypothetical protein RVS70_05405 [Virgibacillus sp. M23]|uniref:hypothetical protein n=1 Tax=Virgibacillus sp. M23 TaxID=3079030 RepID=UPI002A91D663|nr:hypothetical protein [Virgibacillus sp. M23]MDY7043638.1 hypothetical protein [Virgibacillus sp. M23]
MNDCKNKFESCVKCNGDGVNKTQLPHLVECESCDGTGFKHGTSALILYQREIEESLSSKTGLDFSGVFVT